MKYELKDSEKEAIKMFLTHHPQAKILRQYQDWLHFKTGDILIRYRINNEGKERIDPVSAECSVPKKFKIVYIDPETKIPWVKNVNVRGGLGSRIYSLTESTGFVYQPDPEAVDAILMGTRYDPRAQYRSWRRENPNYGT